MHSVRWSVVGLESCDGAFSLPRTRYVTLHQADDLSEFSFLPPLPEKRGHSQPSSWVTVSEGEALSSVSGTKGALDGWQQRLLSTMTDISTGTEKWHLVQSRASGSGRAPWRSSRASSKEQALASAGRGREHQAEETTVSFPLRFSRSR